MTDAEQYPEHAKIDQTKFKAIAEFLDYLNDEGFEFYFDGDQWPIKEVHEIIPELFDTTEAKLEVERQQMLNDLSA